jgi:diaminohydroxyphosphoribosylaminopyrimidine deaminase/5-amino-6-(5-phosphoribosylamino)uracil reductase
MIDARDSAYLEMAYGLAEKARGWASPNPYVGAVVVQGGRIVGHGFHERPGLPHAEAIALQRAGRRAGGSTLYVTLEPCVHWGRTPPCVDAVLRAAPKRVVISSLDPNPVVFKKGVARLRAAGIDLSVGLLKDKNSVLNESYIKFITRGVPFVTLKAALSLDGRIATRMGDSRWISSPLTREYVHLLRGEQDGIMVGIGTILRDDPRLTIRNRHWAGKEIVRVVLDSGLRFPLKARLLSTLGRGRIIVFTTKAASSRKKAALEKNGLEVIATAGSPDRCELTEVMAHLGQRGIASLLVEGGSGLLTAMIEKKLADKVFLTFSPLLIGGEAAPSFLEGHGIGRISAARRLRNVSILPMGDDIIVQGYF